MHHRSSLHAIAVAPEHGVAAFFSNRGGAIHVGALLLIIFVISVVWFFKSTKSPHFETKFMHIPQKQPTAAGVEFSTDRETSTQQAEKYYRDRSRGVR